jgi:glucosamine 6-phosphate synthetase-like amidotransferase/phosphosugar isomerase protein
LVKDEFYVASDASPIIEYTKNVVYLNDEEFAVLHRDGNLEIKTLGNIQKIALYPKAGNGFGENRKRWV